MTRKNRTRRVHTIQEYGARVAVVVDNQERCRMVGGTKRQRYAAFVGYFKRFQRGYGMLLSPQCFDIACSPVLQFDAFCFRDGDVKRFAVL